MFILKKILKSIYFQLAAPICRKMEEQKRELEDRMDILTSGLWDEEYYLQRHNLGVLDGLDPLEHFLKVGWKLGYNPSEYFQVDNYPDLPPELDLNPLAHFLRYRKFQPITFPKNRYPASDMKIRRYLDQKSERKTSKVVYTCITNDYDDLNAIAGYHYIAPDWDYVCFSDNVELVNQGTLGIWEVRPLAVEVSHPVRNNRYHKMLAHRVLPEYDQSIYIDANISILTSQLFDQISERNVDILLPNHFVRDCIYDEILAVQSANLASHDDLAKHRLMLESEGFPKNYGLAECNLIYRRHNASEIVALMKDWWSWLSEGIPRDQLSFAFVMWKHGRKLSDYLLTNLRLNYRNYCVFAHMKERMRCDTGSQLNFKRERL